MEAVDISAVIEDGLFFSDSKLSGKSIAIVREIRI